MDGGARKQGILLIFIIVTSIHLFAPLTLAGISTWDVDSSWRFYSGTASSSGPIYFSNDFTCSQIQITGGLVRFTDFDMGSSWSAIGFSMDTPTANITVREVLQNQITFNCNAPSGISTSQIYGGGKGVPSSVSGVLNWTYVSATDITTTYQNHSSPVEIIIVYGEGSSPWDVDLRVVNSSGLGIEDCTVTLTNTTDTIFSVDTNSTGFIAQQTVDAGDYTLTITRTGYATYEHDYEINANIYWIIRLFTLEETVTITNEFPLEFFGFMFAALGLMYYGWKQWDIENALIGFGLSSIFWIATIGQWIFDTSTDNNLILWWVFLAPLLLCFIKITEVALAYMERTEKNLGRF